MAHFMINIRSAGQVLRACIAKIIEDDIALLASMLAFNLLMSLVPILVLILVCFGFFLNELTPNIKEHLITIMSATISHGAFLQLALYQLTSMATWPVVIIIVIPSVWFGSEFFVAIELCFTRIFHTTPRSFLHQRLMALGLLGIFIVVIPLQIVISTLPTQLKHTAIASIFGTSPWAQVMFLVATVLTDWFIASSFLGIIYVVIPRSHIGQAWKGAIIAGALLTLYTVAFPLLVGGDLRAKNAALNAGFALAVLGFFYFFSFFLLLGAEINAWFTRRIGHDLLLPQQTASASGAAP